MSLLLLVNYWVDLFANQESYNRHELIDLVGILRQEMGRLLGGEDSHLRLASFLAGTFLALVLTLLGGLLSPDLDAAPDYASDQFPNYFFQSVLLVLVLHLIWPALLTQISLSPDHWSYRLLRLDLPFLLALSVGLATLSLSLWGIYHQLHFLYCLGNLGFCLVYAGYRLRVEEKKAVQAVDDEVSDLEDTSNIEDTEGTEDYNLTASNTDKL